jgi:hypothetical protein
MQITNPDNFELGSVKRECRNSCSVFVEIDAGQARRALPARVHTHQSKQIFFIVFGFFCKFKCLRFLQFYIAVRSY